jgi:outer membrane lipoprotein SlyB
VDIPSGTQLNLRLTSRIDSKQNRPGDRFTAEVTTPGPYEGAVVEGHIDKLNQSGKVSGRTEMALAFDSIQLRDGRTADLTASLERIVESETVKTVDEEGNVKTGSRTKDSQTRGAIGGAAGAIIGGIAGGVKGAVLGAVIGGAAGVGTVYIEGNKELILDPGTEMVIRTERTRTR